jgi:hypothetical protein
MGSSNSPSAPNTSIFYGVRLAFRSESRHNTVATTLTVCNNPPISQ